MFVRHIAVDLAGKRIAPSVSLATWIASVQLVDLLWPFFLLAGFEHVRIAPGITPFTPLDFYDYPVTHSLIGSAAWALAFAAGCFAVRGNARIALLVAAGVLSHWVLDVISHPVPVLPHGRYLGLDLWDSIPATLAMELTMFTGGIWLYLPAGGPGRNRVSFWLLMGLLAAVYLGAAFGPPPADVRTLAFGGLAAWIFVPWAWWADRRRSASG